jgi:hypothetical protein
VTWFHNVVVVWYYFRDSSCLGFDISFTTDVICIILGRTHQRLYIGRRSEAERRQSDMPYYEAGFRNETAVINGRHSTFGAWLDAPDFF